MVEIRTNTEVTEISALDDCGAYFIKAVDLSAGGNVEIFAEVTVNASWYNIGKFNKMLSISAFTRKRCNRIKAIIPVRLPEALVHMPSMFFCMGPFCMFSNKGNRVEMLTYAPETNIAVSSSGELEPAYEHVFFNFSEDEKCAKGKKNLRGYSNEFCDLIGSLSGQYFSYLCPRATVTLSRVAEYMPTFVAIFHKYISFFGWAVFLSKDVGHYLKPIKKFLILSFLSLKSLRLTRKI